MTLAEARDAAMRHLCIFGPCRHHGDGKIAVAVADIERLARYFLKNAEGEGEGDG